MKAGAAFSPTHSASLRPSGWAAPATSWLSKRLSTAILECEVDLASMIEAVGVPSCNEPDKPSGDVEEWVRAGKAACGELEVNPPSMNPDMRSGWMDWVVLP